MHKRGDLKLSGSLYCVDMKSAVLRFVPAAGLWEEPAAFKCQTKDWQFELWQFFHRASKTEAPLSVLLISSFSNY